MAERRDPRRDPARADQPGDDVRGAPCEHPREGVAPRRGFLAALTLGIGALAAAVASVPAVAVLLTPLGRRRATTWVPVGRVGDFPVGETVKVTYLEPRSVPWAGKAARSAAWLRRTSDEEIVVFSGACTHVGCPVHWAASAELFLCPCHGGAYHPDGTVAAGPPPRPLPLVPVRIRRGRVEVSPQPITARSTV